MLPTEYFADVHKVSSENKPVGILPFAKAGRTGIFKRICVHLGLSVCLDEKKKITLRGVFVLILT